MEKFGQDYKIRFEVLSKENNKYIENFSCGNRSIDDYFRNKALKDKTSVTYLFIDDTDDKIIACITIACSAIFSETDYEQQFSTVLSAMEVKYLATNEEYKHLQYFRDESKKKTSLSDVIFDYMLHYMFEMSHSQIGAAKVVLYSVPEAKSFYKRHGFKEFGESMYGDKGYYVESCIPMFFDLN